MTDIAIRVENLSKRYPSTWLRAGRIGVREKRADTLCERLGTLAASPFDYLRRTLRGPSEEEIIWALKGVSLEACPELAEGSSEARWWASLRQAQDRHWPQRRGEDHAYFGKLSTGPKVLSCITEPTGATLKSTGGVGGMLGAFPEMCRRAAKGWALASIPN